jgi:hypothetical protein
VTTSSCVPKRKVKEEHDMPPRKRPVSYSSAGILIRESAMQQPRGRLKLRRPKEEVGEEPLLGDAAWRQQQLRTDDDPEDGPSFLKAL